jgi:DNA-directed RNA polymerase specialized sigma24 family protein
MARQYAADLSSEQHRDVVQQTFENLLASSRRYDPDYSVWTYLKQHLCNAVRRVRAAYVPPGQPKWQGMDGDSKTEVSRPTGGISLEDVPEVGFANASWRIAERRVDAMLVAAAAYRVFGDDGTDEALRALSYRSNRAEAARIAGYSRRTLRRRLQTLRNQLSR